MENKIYGRHVILNLEVDDTKTYMLQSIAELAKLLRDSVIVAKATILKSEWHHFGTGHGVTGVLLLAESHISVHTWPEDNYLAIDIFMCGECDPVVSGMHIIDKLNPIKVNTKILERTI